MKKAFFFLLLLTACPGRIASPKLSPCRGATYVDSQQVTHSVTLCPDGRWVQGHEEAVGRTRTVVSVSGVGPPGSAVPVASSWQHEAVSMLTPDGG